MKKKHPRLPNGWGSIQYIGKGRSRPYAVHPPATETNEKGNYIKPKAICYVDDWYVGFAVLNAYRAGTYKPGDEFTFAQQKNVDADLYDALVRRILTDYGAQVSFTVTNNTPTLKAVYKAVYERKFGDNAPRKLSESSKRAFENGFAKFSAIEDKPISAITVADLQLSFDSCELKKPTIESMKSVINQIYKYAVNNDITTKNLASAVIIPERKEAEHGVPFTDDELKLLWEHQTDPVAEFLLIMCYSGFRFSAYKTLETNLEEKYFCGGVKTKSSKGRIVPIHSAILPLVQKRLARDGRYYSSRTEIQRQLMAFNASHHLAHTFHDCRHTFSALCEKYGVKEADRKRMLGHSFGQDITNGIYGHRTLEELRTEIEKICVQLCTSEPNS